MPSKSRGKPSQDFARINKDIKQEIMDMIDEISLSDIRRTADSILQGPNTHLDSRRERTAFKVDIQYKNIGGRFSKKTIVTVMVLDSAISDVEVQEAFRQSLKDNTVWEVS